MDQAILENEFFVQRTRQERRRAQAAHPPYLTEEGMVLVDRREGRDRRAAPAAAMVDTEAACSEQTDLVLERLRRLAALYGYVPAGDKADERASGFTTMLADAA